MTTLRVPVPRIATDADMATDADLLGSSRALPELWALTADAQSVDAGRRDILAGRLRAAPGTVGLLVETCHRVELYGSGRPPLDVLEAASGGARLLEGRDTVRHLLRVAAGLESAVVGEDQVLAQLRRASDGLRAGRRRTGDGGQADRQGAVATDPTLGRLVQVGLGVGRRVRRAQRPRERGLATRALAWLAPHVGGWDGARLLVAGAGDMGMAVALAAAHRGATVVVATRSPRRLPTGLRAVDLAEGARLAATVDGIVVALGGEWVELGATDGALPPIADLSSPHAVPAAVRSRATLIDIDGLFERGRRSRPGDAAFMARAEAEVDGAEAAFLRWAAARPSAPVARRLGDHARRRADARAEAALRRLPNLTERERTIVRQLAGQVAAELLHEPLSRLGNDDTGTAREAARTLFDL
jgi:glutamyl-tRNA reductase